MIEPRAWLSVRIFDIRLATFAELDAEAPCRELINDVLVCSTINPEVMIDYTSVRHTFEHIVVPEGATIAVESLANTNFTQRHVTRDGQR